MRLRIEISTQWMRKQKTEKGLPLTRLVAHLRNEFGSNIVCEEKSFSVFDVSFDCSVIGQEKLVDTIKRFMRKEFGVRDISAVLTISDKDGLVETVASESETEGEELAVTSAESVETGAPSESEDVFASLYAIKGDEKKGEGTLDRPVGDAMGGERAPEDEILRKLDGSSLSSGDGSSFGGDDSIGMEGSLGSGSKSNYIDQADKLIGAEQFKALCHELGSIAPLIKENGAVDCLTNQSYLFSINEGYGLTTVLSIFAGLLGSLGLRNLSDKSFIEVKLPFKADGDKDPFDPYRPGLDELIKGLREHNQHALVCFNISEWMTNVNNRSLRTFIRDYYKHADILTLVFAIPYVNEETFERVKDSLSDMAFIRGVQFPTLSQEQLRVCAKNYLAKYGFSLSEEAWLKFDEKIFQEKKDGRFYGFATVSKVISELLYKKHVICASSDSANKIISASEVDAICSHVVDTEVGMETLNEMVGGDKIRTKLEEIIAQIEVSRMTGSSAPCIHMRFIGNPGTGKTTVARIIGKVLKEKGVLRLGSFYEYSGRDFCGRYIGETAPKTAAMCRDAYGSILFIDEAYSLYRGDDDGKDFGREALDTLIAEMENNRSDLLVIMAGYPVEMEKLMEGNQGLASRMPYVLEFPNFTREELVVIFKTMVKAPYVIGEGLMEKVEEYFKNIPQSFLDSKQFSNARFVRNLFERTIAKSVMRKRVVNGESIVIEKEDFELASTDKEFRNFESKIRKIGFR